MDPSIIPGTWKKVLSNIQTLYPSAIIAGGCLRDTICEKPVKDVDIFINDAEIPVLMKIAALFGVDPIAIDEPIGKRDYIRCEHNFKVAKHQGAEKYGKIDPKYINQETNSAAAALQSYITYIYDMKYNGTLYQFIFIEMDPIPFVEMDFDFGLCKVYFDGITMTVTDEFWFDYERKQLTFSGSHTASQFLHTMLTHRPNLVKKYPGWTVVVDDVRLRTEDEMPPSYKKLMAKYKDEKNITAANEAPQDVVVGSDARIDINDLDVEQPISIAAYIKTKTKIDTLSHWLDEIKQYKCEWTDKDNLT